MKLLVVLLGSNPLPVYVTIKAAQNEEKIGFDKVLFVFSSKTKKYITKIRDKAGLAQETISYCNLEDSHRDPQEIRKKIGKSLTAVLEKHGSNSHIHFNHTGGTKTMAIHGFIAISNFAVEQKIPLTISDLDSDTHRLNVTDENISSIFPTSRSLLDSIKISLEDLINLHGFSTKTPGRDTIEDLPWYRIQYDFFTEFLSDSHIKNFPYSDYHAFWLKEKAVTIVKNNHDRLYEHLKKNKQDYSKEKLLEECHLNTIKTLEKMEDDVLYKNLYGICDFIDGKWLEYLVFSIVKKLLNDKLTDVDEALMGEVVFLGNQKANRDCELDVVIMKGYQLTLISCTTARSISIVKQKAFEAIFRANQLGGEQAKILLVSMMNIHKPKKNHANNLETLKQDLDSFELNQKVELAGKEHLQKSLFPDHDFGIHDVTNLEEIITQMFS